MSLKYTVVKELNDKYNYSINRLCKKLGISRSGYYKWLKKKPSKRQIVNEDLAEKIKKMYEDNNGIFGSRRMTMNINRAYDTHFNHKRVRRIMKAMGISSVIRKRRNCCTIRSPKEQAAENILNRDFHADTYNQKWLTDVTEFKYGEGQKAYLSAIIDLGDNRIIAWTLKHSNNNELVFENFREAVKLNPDAHPIFHSDRGFQYTSPTFIRMLEEAKMTRSMSRVGKCIDNGPMEGFWGIIKTEMYYLNKFETYEELEKAISEYIYFYNYKRYQKRLNCMTPMEYHEFLKTA